MAKETKKKSKTGRIVLLCILAVILFGAATAGSITYYLKFQNLDNMSPPEADEYYLKKLVDKVSKLTKLPSDENPEVGVVKDKSALDETLRNDAENGDLILIYAKNKLLVLYRPSLNKVIRSVPFNEQIVEPKSSTSAPATKVKIIGGATARESAAATLLEKLKDQVSITEKTDAVGAYTTITVIDVTGKNPGKAADLAAALGGTVGELPAGETSPTNADILIVTATN